MNAYDFDGTLYRGDSSADFCLYALRKKPALAKYLPRIAGAGLKYLRGRIDKTAFKEKIFSFLSSVETGPLVDAFWDVHEKKVMPWYAARQKPDDLVISASPEFLIRPIARRLGIRNVIASRVDPDTGRFSGLNCHDEEKVKRLYAEFPDAVIDDFYSDSLSDLPLARLAKRAYFVRGGKPEEWNVRPS